MNVLKSIYRQYNRIEEYFIVYSFLVLIAVVFLQVMFRIVDVQATWTDELSRYIYIWECWLGLSICQRYHQHIRIKLIVDKFPIVSPKITEIIANIITIIAAGALVYLGFGIVSQQLVLGTVSPYLSLPYWVVYLSMPFSCFVYMIRILIETIYYIVKNEPMPAESGYEEVGVE